MGEGGGAMKRVLFVGDGGGDARFVQAMRERGIDMQQKLFICPIGKGRLKRHWTYLGAALHALRRRGDFDAVFIWQQYIGIYYALLSLLGGAGKPFFVYYILYKTERSALADFLKRKVFGLVFKSRALRCAIFASDADPLYASVAEERRGFVWYLECLGGEAAQEHAAKKDVLFSGGASNRDYGVLRELAGRNPDMSVRIACPEGMAEALAPCPDNMVFLHDCYGDSFTGEMARAMAVVVPLGDAQAVSGQLTLAGALEAGTPVFISRSSYLADWLPQPGYERFVIQFDGVRDLEGLLRAMPLEDLVHRGREAGAYAREHLCGQGMFDELAELVARRMGTQAN